MTISEIDEESVFLVKKNYKRINRLKLRFSKRVREEVIAFLLRQEKMVESV